MNVLDWNAASPQRKNHLKIFICDGESFVGKFPKTKTRFETAGPPTILKIFVIAFAFTSVRRPNISPFLLLFGSKNFLHSDSPAQLLCKPAQYDIPLEDGQAILSGYF